MNADSSTAEDFYGCLAGNVRAASRALTRLYDNRLSTVGLRVTQLAVLSQISNLQPVSVAELARHLGSERSGVTRDLRVLEREGLVEISAGADGRSRAVRLTDAAQLRLGEAAEPWRAAQAEVEELLGPTFDALIEGSRLLVSNLENKT